MHGAIFETWVVSEKIKHRLHRGLPPDLYFWRDNHGTDIDMVFEHQGRLQAVEIKSGTTFASDWLAPCRLWHSETHEPLVGYGPLYKYTGWWVRLHAMFFEDVVFDGAVRPRFEKIASA